jgi:hypothetical protein
VLSLILSRKAVGTSEATTAVAFWLHSSGEMVSGLGIGVGDRCMVRKPKPGVALKAVEAEE